MRVVQHKKIGFSLGSIGAVVMLLAVSACQQAPYQRDAFYSRGAPESLLDVSSEVVNLGVNDSQEVKALARWISTDQPTRAELFCDMKARACKEAQKSLRAKGVETNITASPDNVVTLIYERILARDCNPRYIDRHSLYNEPHSAFGCSLAANIVQQVSDKREFVSPALSDDPSAAGAVAAYKKAYKPSSSGGGFLQWLVGSQ
jgi:hypothetical protein